mgnify:CR=1 FL=1
MNTKKTLAVLLSVVLALTLAACGAKTDSEPLPTATPEVTATPEPTAEPAEEVTIHDFDIYVDAFKDENDIEITSTDDGTDIADTDALYVYLYNNGVTRQAVQADLDEGCDSPYIDGYLTYLDDLDKPSETPSNTKIDFSKADAVHDSSEFGGIAGEKVYEINGHYYLEDGLELAKDADGNWAILVPDMGVADNITKEEIDESTQKVVDGFESGDWKKYIGKYGN